MIYAVSVFVFPCMYVMRLMSHLCLQGIPNALRGQVWQMLAGTTFDPQLQDAYRLLITKVRPICTYFIYSVEKISALYKYIIYLYNRLY